MNGSIPLLPPLHPHKPSLSLCREEVCKRRFLNQGSSPFFILGAQVILTHKLPGDAGSQLQKVYHIQSHLNLLANSYFFKRQNPPEWTLSYEFFRQCDFVRIDPTDTM